MTVEAKSPSLRWPDDLEAGKSYLVEIDSSSARVILHGRFDGFWNRRVRSFQKELPRSRRLSYADRGVMYDQDWYAVFRCATNGDFMYIGPLDSQAITIMELTSDTRTDHLDG